MNKEQKTFEKENAYGNNQHLYPFIPYNNESEFTCVGCGETKPHTEFRKRKGGWVSTGCRDCVNVKYERDPQQAHLNAVRNRARRKGVPFNLEYEDITPPEYCPVLGIKLSKWGDYLPTDNKDTAPSIDRLFPELGYTKDNTVIISMKANRMKSNSTLGEIKKLAVWLEDVLKERDFLQ